MGKVDLKKIIKWFRQMWPPLFARFKEWFRQMWPPLFAWFVGVIMSFGPLGIKQLLCEILGVPVKGIFHDIEVLYICVAASTVVLCYVIQEKFNKGNKFFIIMNLVFTSFGSIVYAICKFGELIPQKWPATAIEINEIDHIWPNFIKIFFIVVSAFNIITYALLPGINLPEKSKRRGKT
jgi:hypothetical protein